MRVLGVIPARGGSKGIPRKNLIPLAGQPLLSYTARAAHGSARLTRTILSSEDEEIKTIGRSLGLDVPFTRPSELATDQASSVTVVKHALQFAENQEKQAYDFVCMLQVTCPLRSSQDIDTSIRLLEESDADSIVSIAKVDDPHPWKMMLLKDGFVNPLFPDHWHERLRRQECPTVFFLNGAIYCVRRSVLLEDETLWGRRTLPYIMPPERSANIDSIVDLKLAESLLKN